VVRSGKGKRPDGYVEPPAEELAKLRRPAPEEPPVPAPEESSLAAALEAVFAHRSEIPMPTAAEEPEEEETHRSNRNNRNRRKKVKGESQPKPQFPKQPKEHENRTFSPEGGMKKQPYRRRKRPRNSGRPDNDEQ
jgi:hypothetical protein